MKRKKPNIPPLPPRTEEENRGMQMMHDYLDGADYREGAKWTAPEEDAWLMKLGTARYFAEELWEEENYKAGT